MERRSSSGEALRASGCVSCSSSLEDAGTEAARGQTRRSWRSSLATPSSPLPPPRTLRSASPSERTKSTPVRLLPLASRTPTNSLADSDPATPAAIRAAYPTLAKALDTISEKGTTALAAAAIGAKEGGGKIVTLLGVAKELQGGIEGVVVEPTLACEFFLSVSAMRKLGGN